MSLSYCYGYIMASPLDRGDSSQEASAQDEDELTSSLNTLCPVDSPYWPQDPINFVSHADSGPLSLRLPNLEEGTSQQPLEEEPVFHQEESDENGLKSELAKMKLHVQDLQKNLESVTRQKNEAETRLLEITARHETEITRKNSIIEQLEAEVQHRELQLASVERSHWNDKEAYEEKIASLHKKLGEKEDECKDLQLKIADYKLEVSKMQTEEEKLRRKLAEAEINVAKAREDAAKAREDAAKAREDAAVARLALSESNNRRMRDEMIRSLSDLAVRSDDDEIQRSLTDLTERLDSLESNASSSSAYQSM